MRITTNSTNQPFKRALNTNSIEVGLGRAGPSLSRFLSAVGVNPNRFTCGTGRAVGRPIPSAN